ncbi:hypothetical protein AB0D97_12920, partial [Streptomyces roseus]|uniref:hypothetical protein n=1 Tax=Streptomyces roseus TaxID=66430 RepID=UPI0033FE5394
MSGGRSGGATGGGSAGGAARRPRRTTWIAVAALSAVLVVATAATQVWSYASTESGTLSGGSGERPVTAVEIDAGGAEVRVTPRSDGRVAYEARARWSAGAPKIEEGTSDGSHRLHYLLEDAFVPTPAGPALSDAFL